MLRIYDVMLRVLESLKTVLPCVRRHDGDLDRQLRRAASSVLLNLAEGSGSSGGNRRLRYQNALGSARECQAALHAACALGYVATIDPPVSEGLREVIASLVKLTR